MQIMPAAEAKTYRFNPFDLTKVWPHADYPLIEVGKLTLDRNPENYFAEVEQSAFNPANFVPGIGPSPDKMLQGRLFAYGDAHRYRLGINHTQLPVNCPHAAEMPTMDAMDTCVSTITAASARTTSPTAMTGPSDQRAPVRAAERQRAERHLRMGQPRG